MKICRQIAGLTVFASLVCVAGCELFSPPPQAPPPAPATSAEAPAASASAAVSEPSAPEPQPAQSADLPPAGVETQGGQQTRGRLPKAAINEGVQQGMSGVEACYLKGAQKKPGLRGRILVNFVIAADGSVPYAASLEQGTDFPDNAVIDCVLHVFQTLRFPEPAGGRVVATYPLTLEPAPEATKAE